MVKKRPVDLLLQKAGNIPGCSWGFLPCFIAHAFLDINTSFAIDLSDLRGKAGYYYRGWQLSGIPAH